MGIAPPLVTDKDVLSIWEKMRQARIKLAKSPAIYCGVIDEDQQRENAFRQGIRAELDAQVV
jgi:hypothetical protein